MKRIPIVVWLICVFAWPCLAQVPDEKAETFENFLPVVPRDHWAYLAIDKLVEYKILDSSKAINPDQILTRFEFAILTSQAFPRVLPLLKDLNKNPNKAAPSLLTGRQSRSYIDTPKDYVPNHTPEIADATSALAREFYYELIRLGISPSKIQLFSTGNVCGVLQRSEPFIAELQTQLVDLFKKKNIPVVLGVSGPSLRVEYEVQDFFIHDISESGEVGEQLHIERGPKTKGFVMKVDYMRRHLATSQILLPMQSTQQEQYWSTLTTRIIVRKIPDSNAIMNHQKTAGDYEYLQITYSYGSDADMILRKQINETIFKLAQKYSATIRK